MWVSTFHSACVRILRANADRLGYPRQFSIYDQADAVRLTGYVIRDLRLDAKRFTPRGVHGLISLWKNELLDPADAAARAQNIFDRKHAEVYAEYQARLHKAGAMDFDDLLMNTVRLLRDHPDVLEHYRERFEHILVDEYQDTNQAQNEIVLLLAGGHHNVTVVGDTDQSVYRFRGADFRNILQFEEAFPEVTTVVLDQNYRSTQTILDAANAVIANNAARKPKNLWTDAGSGDRIVRYHAEDEGDEATFVASTARQLHGDEAMNWRDLAVLYRTNAQSRVIEEAMMRLGVPYKVVGGTRFYDRREVKDAMAYLRAVVNPADEVNVKRVLNVPKRGIGDASVAKLDALAGGRGDRLRRGAAASRRRRRHRSGGPRHRRLRRPARRARGAGGAADDGEPAPVPATCCRRRSSAPATSPSWRPRTPSSRPAGWRTSASSSARPASSPQIDEFLEQVSLVADTDDLPDGEIEDQVVLMTLHSAKGLEFPVVFLIGAEEGVFPHSQGAHRARRAGGGAAARLRRHHPGPRAAVRHPRVEPQPVRHDAVQPAVAVPRGDPRRARRLRRATSPGAARTGVRACARARTGVRRRRTAARAAATPSATTSAAPRPTASGSSTPRSPPGGAAPPQPSDAHDLGLRIGDDVEHPAFGEGVIIDLRGRGEQAEATVNFRGVGTKHLSLAWAPLRKR